MGGHAVDVDFLLFESDEMARYLGAAGFEIEEIIERDPYPDVEYPSRRAYIFARTPAGSGALRARPGAAGLPAQPA